MRTQFFKGTFKDYTGADRTYIIAAVIDKKTQNIITSVENAQTLVEAEYHGDCMLCALEKVEKDSSILPVSIYFGVALSNPKDKIISDELGERIAEGKALVRRSRLGEGHFSSGMLLNADYVQECLRRYSQLVERNPENFSKAYAEAKEKHEKRSREKAGSSEE